MADLSPSGFGSWMVADDKTAPFGRQSKLKIVDPPFSFVVNY